MKKIILDTPSAPKAVGTYNQAVEINNLIFTSGQIGLDPLKGQLVKGGMRLQTEQILTNIRSILMDIGLDKENIIKLTVFLIDLEQFSIVNESFQNFFSDTEFPARSTVEVSKLPLDALVEIECIAHR
tara:strand:+ start:138 stop:521 length:384 start_codon:yes stop_codon:yes gene_type:complete